MQMFSKTTLFFVLSFLIMSHFSWSQNLPPKITSFQPGIITTKGGSLITIKGTNFNGITQVLFGNTPAINFVVHSNTLIVAVSPPNASPISVNLTVINSAGSSNAVPIYYSKNNAPILKTITPNTGVEGTVLTIAGVNFSRNMIVFFGNTQVKPTTISLNSQTLTVSVPSIQLGTTPVSLGNANIGNPPPYDTAVSNTKFFFQLQGEPIPTIIPSAALYTPTNLFNEPITLFGTNFTSKTRIVYGNELIKPTVTSSTTMHFRVPGSATATRVPIRAINFAGISNELFIYYIPLPTITSISPASGPAAGGYPVVVNGTLITPETVVLIQNLQANTSVTITPQILSSKQLQFIMPNSSVIGSPSVAAISIENRFGLSYLSPGQFTFTN